MSDRMRLKFTRSSLCYSAFSRPNHPRTTLAHSEILEEHRKLCVAQGKYAEAEISRVRLDELRRYEEHRRREAMVTYQVIWRTANRD